VQKSVFLIAERMRDREYVSAIMETARKRVSNAASPSLSSTVNLASGDTGIALMYSYLDACFPEQRWDALAQHYLQCAAAKTQEAQIGTPGLFDGTTGMAFTLRQASRGGTRYRKTLNTLHEGLCAQVLARLWRHSGPEEGTALHDFDLISGAAGILAYLVSLEQPAAVIQQAIAHLLEYLLWLGEPGQPAGRERWYISPARLPNDLHRQAFPQGNFNCGLAHGIPGPLAALSLTWLAGYRFPGLRETIAYLADWIIGHRIKPAWGIDWPDSIPLESASTADEWQRLSPTRTAWCYGAPGVARSLWLAGSVLEDDQLRRTGIAAIESALRHQFVQRDILSPILCHGTAGLLHICLRFAHESQSSLVQAQIPLLVEQILEVFHPSFPLGFRASDEDMLVDQPGWLGGAPGIAMVLLAATTDVMPTWDRALAIA
jgi:lantibiotic modifying enzyme